MPESFATKFTRALIAARWWLLGVAVILAAIAWAPANNLQFDRRIENMFADDDPLLPAYHRLQRTFGGNEIVLAVFTEPDLMSDEGMERLAKLSAKADAVPGVAEVLTLQTLALGKPELPSAKLIELFEGYTHGADHQTAALVCLLEAEGKAEAPRTETVRQLRDIVRRLPSGVIAGEPVMVVNGFEAIERDGRRLGVVSSTLLVLTILLCFRSIRWVVIPLAVVQFTLLLTRAILVTSGMTLSMVSSMLTAIVTVVGVATVIHIVVHFRDARGEGLSPREALTRAGGKLAGPILFTCATDAVGFSSLLYSSVGPISDFGMMMAIGSLLVIISVALLVPGLALLGRFDPDPKRAWGEARLDRALRGLLGSVERRPKTVAFATIIAAAVIASGSFRIEVETDFTNNFRQTSPIVRSYAFVETNLGGAGVWDIVLPAPENLDWEYLRRVLELEKRLRAEVPELTKVLSFSDAVKATALIDPDSIPSGLFRNTMVNTQTNLALATMRRELPIFSHALHGQDPETGDYYLRILLRAHERQPSADKQRQIAAVGRIVEEEFPAIRDRGKGKAELPGEAEVTGYFVLLAGLIESIVRDQWTTFGIATLGIGLMMIVALRSVPLALVALVPNALPIVMVMGLLGWLGLKLNMGAAMIAAVSMGLSIDSSIHYIISFQRARRRGLRVPASLDHVQQTVGRAAVFSTLALIVGFAALMQSEFVPTIYFGALVSLTMLGGLAGNLVVLPLLLQLVTRNSTS